jgi:hypothetical protein
MAYATATAFVPCIQLEPPKSKPRFPASSLATFRPFVPKADEPAPIGLPGLLIMPRPLPHSQTFAFVVSPRESLFDGLRGFADRLFPPRKPGKQGAEHITPMPVFIGSGVISGWLI